MKHALTHTTILEETKAMNNIETERTKPDTRMSESTFRETCFFALGVFCWELSNQLVLSVYGGQAGYDPLCFSISIVAIIVTIAGIRYGKRYYATEAEAL